MWLLRKKSTLEACGYFHGFVDWHNHILPGVDDGVQTIDEALQILAEYERLRIKEVWLTPHIMEDIPNTTKHLQERFDELQSAYSGNITLHLASENMLDKLLRNDWNRTICCHWEKTAIYYWLKQATLALQLDCKIFYFA